MNFRQFPILDQGLDHFANNYRSHYMRMLNGHMTQSLPLCIMLPPVDEGVSNPAYEEELVPTTLQLSSELNGISDKWFEIGLRLNVPSSILNTIRRVNADDKEVCLMKMCDEWLQREVDPSWSDVVEALESRFVTEQRVADVIQMRYCEPSLDEELITTVSGLYIALIETLIA